MTNLECLRALGDLPMFSLASIPTWRDVRPASVWADTENEEDNYEIRDEKYWYGTKTRKVIGVVGGMTIYRQANT